MQHGNRGAFKCLWQARHDCRPEPWADARPAAAPTCHACQRQRGLLAGVGVDSLPQQQLDNGGVAMPARGRPRRARCQSIRGANPFKKRKHSKHSGMPPGHGHPGAGPAPCLQAVASAVSPAASLSSNSPRQQPRLNSSRRQAACGQAPADVLQPGPGCSAATSSSVCFLASAWGQGQQAGHQGRACRHAGTLNTSLYLLRNNLLLESLALLLLPSRAGGQQAAGPHP